ncbi:histone methyltransferase set2 [Tilletia horrida]|nr:histone methyltransferase set2 [Tilletia horrida]
MSEVDSSSVAVKSEAPAAASSVIEILVPPRMNSDMKVSSPPSPSLLDLLPPTPPPMEQDEEDTPPPSPRPIVTKGGRGGRGKGPKIEPQIVLEWPVADKEAMATFKELPGNTYQSKAIGRSRGKEEGIVCECTYRYGIDHPTVACGHDSGCINRLTQVECLEEECQTRGYCQNQRFQKREYANIEIVLTPNKGYGVRTPVDLERDTFIYEYIGEVINQSSFLKRMQQYKDEGIRHFYFMMLQREEYLDATKKGGKARFLNHSCNPNCYVEKWQVGKHMRMGIFARRAIRAGEELTFNYNVDRYGNDAQDCFCGEPNCVGSIGGKTQTDIATFDDIFIEALGIEEEVDALDAKGRRGKKAKHLDEDYNPIMRPIQLEEAGTVVSAIKQATSNRRVLEKLLSRVIMTEDTNVHRAMVRLHGFVLLSGVMDEWRDEVEVVLQVLQCLARFPLLKRNKVISTGVDKQVGELITDEADARIRTVAGELLKSWEQLEMEYVIAKRELKEGESHDDSFARTQKLLAPLEELRAPANVSSELRDIVASRYYVPMDKPAARPRPFAEDFRRPPEPPSRPPPPPTPSGPSLEDIIKAAREKAERERLAAAEAEKLAVDQRLKAELEAKERKKRKALLKEGSGSSSSRHGLSSSSSAKRHREGHQSSTSSSSRPDKRRRSGEEDGHHGSSSSSSSSSRAKLEKKLESLVSELVVNTMSKSKDKLDREVFKKHAKELTKIICEKEKKNPKSWPPSDGKLEALEKRKREKMKEFANEYIKKLIARKGKDDVAGSSSAAGANGHSAAGSDLAGLPTGLSTPGPSSSITSTPSLTAAGGSGSGGASSLTAINAILSGSGAGATPITPIEADGDLDMKALSSRSRSSSGSRAGSRSSSRSRSRSGSVASSVGGGGVGSEDGVRVKPLDLPSR